VLDLMTHTIAQPDGAAPFVPIQYALQAPSFINDEAELNWRMNTFQLTKKLVLETREQRDPGERLQGLVAIVEYFMSTLDFITKSNLDGDWVIRHYRSGTFGPAGMAETLVCLCEEANNTPGLFDLLSNRQCWTRSIKS